MALQREHMSRCFATCATQIWSKKSVAFHYTTTCSGVIVSKRSSHQRSDRIPSDGYDVPALSLSAQSPKQQQMHNAAASSEWCDTYVKQLTWHGYMSILSFRVIGATFVCRVASLAIAPSALKGWSKRRRDGGRCKGDAKGGHTNSTWRSNK